MNINILSREFKSKKLEVNSILYCYLLAIRNKDSEIWQQLKNLINKVDNEVLP